MKKINLKFALTAAAILASLVLGVPGAFVLFLIAGVIPGTNFAIPSSLMLLFMITLLWLSAFASAEQLWRTRSRPAVRSAAASSTPKRHYTEL